MPHIHLKFLNPLVLAAMVAANVPATAQVQRSMTVVDLINLPSISDPQIAPDGKHIVYVQAEANWKANKRISQIWRVNTDGSGPIQLTSGTESATAPRWSPDGKTLAFVTKRGDDEANQVYLLPTDGGEARRLTKHETAVAELTWSPDGTFIYVVASDPKTTEEKVRDKAKDDVFAFDENFKQKHLWKVTVGEPAERQITKGGFSVIGYRLSLDGTKIAFHRAPTPLYGDADQGEVWVMGADGNRAVRLTTNSVTEVGAELSPDNAHIIFVADSNETWESYYNDNIFLVPATGGETKMLTKDLPYEVTGATWSKDGKAIYFSANMGVHSELFALDLASGTSRQMTEGKHSLGGVTYRPALDRFVFTIDEPTNAGDVWTMTPSDKAPMQVSHAFDHLVREFKLPRQERIEWKGADGVTVEGLLFYPLDYQEGQRYPLCVQTHGGPAASDRFGFGRWQNYTQVLAAKGYAVVQPNYRGSTGYGDPFLRDMVGHYYKNSHLDVMAAVDHLIKIGIADPDRMVKMGWSGGGHMTNKIITFTDRFKAASSGAGAVNWISMYGQSDVRSYRTPWFGGTPWQKNAPIDLYWDHSPLKDIANAKTPTLILVGEQDVRVPPPQSIELYRALKTNGVATHLYVAPREPHGWQELRHELFKVNVELDWFEKYATKRPYVWEKAPGQDARK